MRLLLIPPVLMLVLFAPAAVAYRFIDPAIRPPFLIYGLRWFLGLLFTISGLAKLIPGFPNTMGPVDLEHSLAPHGLALFGRFIAVSEVGVGLLLLTRRFATLGALALVPMLTCILVITTVLEWRGTPMVVAGFLALAIVLLAYDYPKLLVLVGDRPAPESRPRPGPWPLLWWLAAAGIVLIGLGAHRISATAGLEVPIVLAALTALVVADWYRRSQG